MYSITCKITIFLIQIVTNKLNLNIKMAILTISLTFFINDHYIIIVMNNKFTWNSIVALTPLSIISWKHCRSLSGNSNVNSTADVQDKSTAIRKNWIVCIDSMASISCFIGSLQPDNGKFVRAVPYTIYRYANVAAVTIYNMAACISNVASARMYTSSEKRDCVPL